MTPESPQQGNNNTNNLDSNNSQNPYEQQDHYHDLQEDEEDDDIKNDTDSRVLFVFNLTVDTREEDIIKEFSAYGKVESVKIVMDRKKLINRGFCFVTMASVEDAGRLKDVKIIVKGQALHIEKAARTEGHNSTPGQGYQGKRTPRERLMPKSLRDKDHPRSRGSGRDNGRGRGGKGAPPFRQRERGGHTPKGGRAPPGSYPHHLPPSSGQPPYGYYDYYYGYPPYGQFPPPPGTPLSEEHRGASTGSSTTSATTNGTKDGRPFSANQPYGTSYPPGAGYPPYSGYPPGAYGYPPGAYGYYPPYGPNGNYENYPPYTPPGTREPSSPPPGTSSRPNRISPSRTHPHHGGPRYYSSSGAGSNYRYNPYPSVSEGASGNVPSGPHHQPPSPGGDYESPPYGNVYGESQPWINK